MAHRLDAHNSNRMNNRVCVCVCVCVCVLSDIHPGMYGGNIAALVRASNPAEVESR
jgi:hypothetical protein